MQQVQTFFQTSSRAVLDYYPNRFSLVGATLCASAALERTIDATSGLYSLLRGKHANGSELPEEHAEDYLGDLKGQVYNALSQAAFYGICASNIVPGTAILGAIMAVAQNTLEDRGYRSPGPFSSLPFRIVKFVQIIFAELINSVTNHSTYRTTTEEMYNSLSREYYSQHLPKRYCAVYGIGLLGLGYGVSLLSWATIRLSLECSLLVALIAYRVFSKD